MKDTEGEEEFKNDKEIELDDKGHSPNKKKISNNDYSNIFSNHFNRINCFF